MHGPSPGSKDFSLQDLRVLTTLSDNYAQTKRGMERSHSDRPRSQRVTIIRRASMPSMPCQCRVNTPRPAVNAVSMPVSTLHSAREPSARQCRVNTPRPRSRRRVTLVHVAWSSSSTSGHRPRRVILAHVGEVRRRDATNCYRSQYSGLSCSCGHLQFLS
jgi:hypothetical protein